MSFLGILKGLTTPRSRNRVSFVEAPQVFILSSTDDAPLSTQTEKLSTILPETILVQSSESSEIEIEPSQDIPHTGIDIVFDSVPDDKALTPEKDLSGNPT